MRITRLAIPAALVLLASTLVASSPATAASPAGNKHLTAKITASNHLVVDWHATSAARYYLVRTSSTLDMSHNIKTYKVSKKHTKYTIDATASRYNYAKPSSGNYIFVRVYAPKTNGNLITSPAKAVRLNPPAAPAGAQQVKVATFNVRTADLDVPHHGWASRITPVADRINASGASVVALEEAGTNLGKTTFRGGYDIHWQFEDVERAAAPQYDLVYSDEYAKGANTGKEGTRILYDTSKLSVVSSGFFAPSAVNKYLRWVPWALFQDRSTGEQFYFIAAHLDNRADKGKSHTYYNLRLKQIKKIIDVARDFRSAGHQVILAGDLNSNIYSKPDNGVDRKLMSAGFYDAYATANNVNSYHVTYNDFKKSKVNASRTDYIMTFGRADLRGAYSYKNWISKSDGVYPSDHNMQSAVVPF
ncbi:hypothetical protein BH11ACT2_BH11ACT2_06400 [soil metagenome]